MEQIDAPAWKEINERWFSNTAELSRDSRKVGAGAYHVFDYVTPETCHPEAGIAGSVAGISDRRSLVSQKNPPASAGALRACELNNL